MKSGDSGPGSGAVPEPEAGQPSSSSSSTRSVTIVEGSSSSPAAAVASGSGQPLSRYESQKKRDWNTFLQYLTNHNPPLTLPRCSSAHVIEFLKYLDQFGKTKVHLTECSYFGQVNPPAPCPCPLKQAWGSLDALIGRLRAAYEENGGRPETNPFGARAVRIYLKEVRESQAKARGIPYEKKRKRQPAVPSVGEGGTSRGGEADPSEGGTSRGGEADPCEGGTSRGGEADPTGGGDGAAAASSGAS